MHLESPSTNCIELVLNVILTYSSIDSGWLCCKEVLIFIADELKEDWNLFLKTLIKETSSEEIPIESESGKETIIKYFESNLWQVKWDDLERTLSKMEKGDIIEQIKKQFLYTKGTKVNERISCLISFFYVSAGKENEIMLYKS